MIYSHLEPFHLKFEECVGPYWYVTWSSDPHCQERLCQIKLSDVFILQLHIRLWCRHSGARVRAENNVFLRFSHSFCGFKMIRIGGAEHLVYGPA